METYCDLETQNVSLSSSSYVFLAVRLGQARFPYLYSDTTIVSNVVVKVTCFKFFFFQV